MIDWSPSGWNTSEEFETWFEGFATHHPARGREKFAKDYIVTRVVQRKMEHQGKPLRSWLESAHRAYMHTKNWRAGYVPNLYNWLSEETWMRLPAGYVEPKPEPEVRFSCRKCLDCGTTGAAWVTLEQLQRGLEVGVVHVCECGAGGSVKEMARGIAAA